MRRIVFVLCLGVTACGPVPTAPLCVDGQKPVVVRLTTGDSVTVWVRTRSCA